MYEPVHSLCTVPATRGIVPRVPLCLCLLVSVYGPVVCKSVLSFFEPGDTVYFGGSKFQMFITCCVKKYFVLPVLN